MHNDIDQTSKFLSYLLRHEPDTIGLKLDENGWANIDELIDKAKHATPPMQLNRNLISKVVRTSDKQRFRISEDGMHIRASQGHSIQVDLKLVPSSPPPTLYHGTATRFLESILAKGLVAGERQYVHLSTDVETASNVGKRYGKPVVLAIDTQTMLKQGYHFYISDNGVWMTKNVPSKFIKILD